MNAWDNQYLGGQGRYWPNEELVRYLSAKFGPMPIRNGLGKTAIDLGCGAGGNAWALAKWGFFVRALDGSAEAVKSTKERMNEENLDSYVLAQQHIIPSSLRLPSGSIEIAVDAHTLQHVDEAAHEMAYREIHRLLYSGGRIFQYHWCGTKEDRAVIFPDHPELDQTADLPLDAMLHEAGFSVEHSEVVVKSYSATQGVWKVIGAVKP